MTNWFKRIFGMRSNTTRRQANDPNRYRILKLIGKGTFGSVYLAKDKETYAVVAIKKIKADPNAEVELKFKLDVVHKNVILLLGHFREVRKDTEPPVIDLCLVMEYSKISLRDCIDTFRKKQKAMPHATTMLYTYQIFRGLHYLHSLKIMHRDINPSNILVSKKTSILKICDLGSAKRIVPGESRHTDVVARPYRAPELELGNEDYNEKVDIWAAACVVFECCTGNKLFREQWSVKHYDIICELLGDPTPDDIVELLPMMKGLPLKMGRRLPTFDQRFGRVKPPLPATAVSLIKSALAYKPSQRPSAIEVCAMQFYDHLRQTSTYDELLYDFTASEIADVRTELLERIVPVRCRNMVVMKKVTERLLHDANQSWQHVSKSSKLSSGE